MKACRAQRLFLCKFVRGGRRDGELLFDETEWDVPKTRTRPPEGGGLVTEAEIWGWQGQRWPYSSPC